MASRGGNRDGFRAALRTLVIAFPPLRLALSIHDFVLLLLAKLRDLIYYLIKQTLLFLIELVSRTFSFVAHLIPDKFRPNLRSGYERLGCAPKTKQARQHKEPIPYESDWLRRSITYHSTIMLALILYVFVYFVLIKHHTLLSVLVATIFLLIYLIIIENSHQIRSILMLCLPIMFTNRGRALIFCYMLGTLAQGPMRTTQENVKQLHSSLQCCKQYLILKADKMVEENVVRNIIKVEDMLMKLIQDLKEFGADLREKLDKIIAIAMTVEEFAIKALDQLKKIAALCHVQSEEIIKNCYDSFRNSLVECKSALSVSIFSLCDILAPAAKVCHALVLPEYMCSLPRFAVDFIDETIGQRLKLFFRVIENEFYVKVDVQHNFTLDSSKTKNYTTVAREIGLDVERKFWYVHMIGRVFNFISLILVIWILITATLYHLHYLTELSYDNIYLDDRIRRLDDHHKHKKQLERESRASSRRAAKALPEETSLISLASDEVHTVRSAISDEEILSFEEEPASDFNENEFDRETVRSSIGSISSAPLVNKDDDDDDDTLVRRGHRRVLLLFPMTRAHERQYLKPFSFSMGEVEMKKLRLAGLVWLVICGYIFFFVMVDFALYSLLRLTVDLLKEILFSDELPVVSVSSKAGDKVVRYNRTYLRSVRQERARLAASSNDSLNRTNNSVSSLYRKMMDSLEKNIPNDLEILDSLEECMPSPKHPMYEVYETLLYMALLTFGAVILEAYALRLRHWIANLFYPKRAKQRVRWLYEKMLKEKPKFENILDEDNATAKPVGRREQMLVAGVNLITNKAAKNRAVWK